MSLPDASATVVYGEAMLSMQKPARKQETVREAYRLLKSAGRYGIHELRLPDDLSEDVKQAVQNELAAAIHHDVRPPTTGEWKQLLEAERFVVHAPVQAPKHLLEPRRIVQDEGLPGACRFGVKMLLNREARRRFFGDAAVFFQV